MTGAETSNAQPRAASGYEQLPHILTYGGEARSGKGTSVAAVKQRLSEVGIQHRVIDQGLKFRVLAELALTQRKSMDDQTELTDFLSADSTHSDLLRTLDEVAAMKETEVKSYIYNPVI